MRKKILVCDDEQHIVKLIQVNLEKHGHEVFVAHDGREALKVIKAESPDVCILDVMMPYVDGIEVLKSIRNDPNTEHILVIMITVKAQDEDVFKAYSSGADLYLTKPFDPIEVIKFLELI